MGLYASDTGPTKQAAMTKPILMLPHTYVTMVDPWQKKVPETSMAQRIHHVKVTILSTFENLCSLGLVLHEFSVLALV